VEFDRYTCSLLKKILSENSRQKFSSQFCNRENNSKVFWKIYFYKNERLRVNISKMSLLKKKMKKKCKALAAHTQAA